MIMEIMYMIMMVGSLIRYLLTGDTTYYVIGGIFFILVYLEGLYKKLELISKQNEMIILSTDNIQKSHELDKR